MSTLAGPLEFNAPPMEFINSIPDLSIPAKTLFWYGLAPNTRLGYNSAINSYTLFCATHTAKAWPAAEPVLIKWVTGRIFGSAALKQGQIQPTTVESYLSALKSYHVDRNLSTQAFSSFRIKRVLAGARSLFPQIKKDCLPITKDILEKITAVTPISIEDLNIDTAFKVARAGFLRMGEFTYTSTEAQAQTFANTKLTRSDITFSDEDQHVILRLKRSKTDINHTGIEIILAATNDKTCLVTALRTLFTRDPQPRNAPIFRLTGRSTAFARKPVLDILQERLRANGIVTPKSYTGHSFRKGAAQHAFDNGMLDQHIQKLGRWTSKAFQLYFQTSISSLYTLSMRFQTGRAISLTPQTSPSAPSPYHNHSPPSSPLWAQSSLWALDQRFLPPHGMPIR